MNKIGSQFSTSLVASLTLKTDTWWQYQMRLVQQLGRYTMVHFTNVNANATWNMSRRSTVYSNQIRNGSLTVANSSQFSIELQFTIQKSIFCSAAFQEWFCCKGQLISESIYEVIVSHKIRTKNCQDFCPQYTGQKSWQFFVRILGETMTS